MKLNVCCGKDYREGYVNIDFAGYGSDMTPLKVDLVHDVRRLFPTKFVNNVDEIIFREAAEHFNRHDVVVVLRNLYEILKLGGKLNITVPPAEQQLKILLTMLNRDVTFDDFIHAHEKFTFWKYHDDLMGACHETIKVSPGGDPGNCDDYIDLGQGDSHKTLFTQKSLRSILEHVGFKIDSINNNIEVWCHK